MSKEKIEETLKRLANDTSVENSQTTSRAENQEDRAGAADCPHCHGQGYLRRDLPPNDPGFGKLEVCTCRRPQMRAQVRERLFSLSQLDELEQLTFETFKSHGNVGTGEREQESIERAYNQARLFSEKRQGWLLLQGGYGCGKTHLAAAVANACVSLGYPTLFLTVPDLLDTLRFAFSSEDATFEQRFQEVRNAPLLVLDDFGTQNTTDWAREKLFQILNYRYINHLPLVVTTNLSLEEIEGRIRSRLADPTLVTHCHIHAPDYRRPEEDTGQHKFSSIAHHVHQTFGTFNLRKGDKLPQSDLDSLEKAFEAARIYAEDPVGWLVFLGLPHSGKTHLAAAIANYRASQGHMVMFVYVTDLLDHLRATFNPNSSVPYDRRFEEVRTAPLLVLDDLGPQAMTPWVREKLYQLFNHRYNAKLPTVITTVDKLENIDSRLRARLLDRRVCDIYMINAPAFDAGKPRSRRSKR